MRLSKNNLLVIGIIPIIIGLIIFYNFIAAINILQPGGMTTAMVYYQLLGIATAMFVGAVVYWVILVYYIYLIQENEVFIQDNFTQLAGSGTAHRSRRAARRSASRASCSSPCTTESTGKRK